MGIALLIPFYNQRQIFDRLRLLCPKLNTDLKFLSTLILIDDYSTDGSSALAQQLCQQIPFLRVIENKGKKGQISALLSALPQLGSFDALAIADLDHLLESRELAKFISSFNANIEVLRGVRTGRTLSLLRRVGSVVANAINRLINPLSRPDLGSTLYVSTKRCLQELAEIDRANGPLLLSLVIPLVTRKIAEVEVEFQHQAESSYRLKELFGLFLVLIKTLRFLRARSALVSKN